MIPTVIIKRMGNGFILSCDSIKCTVICGCKKSYRKTSKKGNVLVCTTSEQAHIGLISSLAMDICGADEFKMVNRY